MIRGFFEFEFCNFAGEWMKTKQRFEAKELIEVHAQKTLLQKFGGNIRNIKVVFKGSTFGGV